jgi:hypothetical protein
MYRQPRVVHLHQDGHITKVNEKIPMQRGQDFHYSCCAYQFQVHCQPNHSKTKKRSCIPSSKYPIVFKEYQATLSRSVLSISPSLRRNRCPKPSWSRARQVIKTSEAATSEDGWVWFHQNAVHLRFVVTYLFWSSSSVHLPRNGTLA